MCSGVSVCSGISMNPSADARDQWREAKKEKGEECGVPRDRSDHDTETMPIVDVEQTQKTRQKHVLFYQRAEFFPVRLLQCVIVVIGAVEP